MSWKKFFSPVNTENSSPLTNADTRSRPGPAKANYSSFLPDIYTGSPNRIDRYQQYEIMDSDPECAAALDILAEFCSQKLKDNSSPFSVKWRHKATNSEIRILSEYMQQWIKLQLFDTRIFRVVRNTFKYGDCFFIRDPETYKWHWVDPSKIVKIIVNESDGKCPEQYIIKDLAPNFEHLVVTQITPNINPRQTTGGVAVGTSYYGASSPQHGSSSSYPSSSAGSRFALGEFECAVDAEHVVHLSLSEGLDNNYPFGNSLLENVYKVYKQKELLEDAILIYRIHRAPERRVFHIDVGNMPSHLAMSFVERFKNEIHSRKIPGSCLTLDTKIPLLDGRVLELKDLIDEHNSGKQNWVYSCNPDNGAVVPGIVSWAGITGTDKQVMKLTLDNGQTITCTPDHKFPILGKGFVEAKDLELGESFIPGYLREFCINKSRDSESNTYKQIFDPCTKKWNFVHRVVATSLRGTACEEFLHNESFVEFKKNTVHHKDFNRYNNNPENLCWMSSKDHFKYHSDHGKEFWNYIKSDEQRYAAYVKQHSARAKRNWQDPEYIKNHKAFRDSYDYSVHKFDEYLFDIFKEYYFSVNIGENVSDIINKLKNDERFITRFYELHSEKYDVKVTYIDGLVAHFGYDSYMDFRKQNPTGGFKRKYKKPTEIYNLDHEILNVVRKIYARLKENIHYTQTYVGFSRLYRNIQQDQEFIEHFQKLNPEVNKQRFGPDLFKSILSHHGFTDYTDFREKADFLNHKLVKIEYLTETQTVGTLTIDSDEQYHNYHTFLLNSGVFTKNSSSGQNIIDGTYNAMSVGEDYFFPKSCLALNTKIRLLDNTTATLQELIDDYRVGKINHVYTVNQKTLVIESGKIVWAGKTRLNAQVVDITLSNDCKVRVTPDHIFILSNGDELPAQYLKVGTEIMPLNPNDSITITDVKWVESVEDTGDITVESVNDNHNFSLAADIFVHNSEGRGSDVTTLPGGCFSMDTKVSLLDGRELSIGAIEQELATNKELWTYSCEPVTGKIVPGLISWAGVTQRQVQVMKITLDNGEEIICTPDHKFCVYTEPFKRADELTVGESLIPLYRRRQYIDERNEKGNTYEQVFDNQDKTWEYTHRVVAKNLKDQKVLTKIYNLDNCNGKFKVVHHKNFNRYDNSPNNLCWMNGKDHFKYHVDYNSLRIATIKQNDPEEYQRQRDKQSAITKARYALLSPEEKQRRCEQRRVSMKAHIASLTLEEIDDWNQKRRQNFIKGNKVLNQMMIDNPEYRQQIIDKRANYWTEETRKLHFEKIRVGKSKYWASDLYQQHLKAHSELQSVTYTHAMLLEVINLVKGKTTHEVTLNDVANELNNNVELLTSLSELNKFKKVKNWNINRGFTTTGIATMVKQFGYENWKDFRVKESIHNHRITKIEYLDELMDVGTLTIDNDEIYHDYHTFALTAGVMVKNSAIGELDDLKYFTNKLFRGLRIPSSYLPTGADDSQANFNDGRVGTAYIQELRFNKYCERLQSLISTTFDREFKMYIYNRGLNIDAGLFELEFNPPMNFASSRQAAVDAERISTFNTIQAIPFMSKRFAMKRFLGLTEEEMAENERLWGEESGRGSPSKTDAAGELRSAGLSSSNIAGDLDMAGDLSIPDEMMDQEETPDETTPESAKSQPEA